MVVTTCRAVDVGMSSVGCVSLSGAVTVKTATGSGTLCDCNNNNNKNYY